MGFCDSGSLLCRKPPFTLLGALLPAQLGTRRAYEIRSFRLSSALARICAVGVLVLLAYCQQERAPVASRHSRALELFVCNMWQVADVQTCIRHELSGQVLQAVRPQPTHNVSRGSRQVQTNLIGRAFESAYTRCLFKLPRAVSSGIHDGGSCAEKTCLLEQPELACFEHRQILEDLCCIVYDIHTRSLDHRCVPLEVKCGKPSIELALRLLGLGAVNSSVVTGFGCRHTLSCVAGLCRRSRSWVSQQFQDDAALLCAGANLLQIFACYVAHIAGSQGVFRVQTRHQLPAERRLSCAALFCCDCPSCFGSALA